MLRNTNPGRIASLISLGMIIVLAIFDTPMSALKETIGAFVFLCFAILGEMWARKHEPELRLIERDHNEEVARRTAAKAAIASGDIVSARQMTVPSDIAPTPAPRPSPPNCILPLDQAHAALRGSA